MSDSAVARVLWALERVGTELDALYDPLCEAYCDEPMPTDATDSEFLEWRLRRAQEYGVIEGLSAARTVLVNVRTEYARKHSSARGGHQARVLAAAIEEEPAGRSGL